MISFQNKKYQLFFSNNLAPLVALNYADELFFKYFEKYVGARYRILSIIRAGWQEKYGRTEDIENLKKAFQKKLKNKKWIKNILAEYRVRSKKLRKLLDKIEKTNYSEAGTEKPVNDLNQIRESAAPLDAMSNLLHLFSESVAVASKASVNLRKILEAGTFIKADVSKLLGRRRNGCNNLYKALAKILKCRLRDVEYLAMPEIVLSITKKRNFRALIKQRRQIAVLFYAHKNLKIYQGSGASKFLRRGSFAKILVKKNTKILTGQVASPGLAQGKAVVVKNSRAALRQMQKGNILVAPYTAAEYLPAMKLASALVTETGGITSHAAVVAREFKIPCVIGVKDVTELLRTGDMIMVDANKGQISKM